MKPWSLSIAGLTFAIVYAVIAIYVVRAERIQPGGGWISLRGMGTYLITLPVSGFCEWIGAKLDYRRNVDMAAAVGLTAALVYVIVAGVIALSRLIIAAVART